MHSLGTRIFRDAVLVAVGLFIVMTILKVPFPRSEPKGEAQPTLPTATLRVNKHLLTVEIADESVEQQQGLSFRESLGPDEGMLFMYSAAGPQSFWMYGMHFPLDLIFIRNGQVVDYEENVPPPAQTSGRPSTITSQYDADTVLEIPAGRAKELGIGIRTNITLE